MDSCQRCGIATDKKELNRFDSTFRGKRKTGEKLKLCRNCLFQTFSEYLKNYNARAVMVYPMKDKHANAYQFYSLDYMRNNGWSDEYVVSLQTLLPLPGSPCQVCENNMARFTWCDPGIYRNNYMSNKLMPAGTYDQKLLCANCILEQFKLKVNENNKVFDEFMPPVDAEGFSTSFEA